MILLDFAGGTLYNVGRVFYVFYLLNVIL